MSRLPEYQHRGAHQSPHGLASLSAQDLEQMSDEDFWELARQRAFMAPGLLSHEEYLACVLAHGTYLIPLKYLAEVIPPPHRLALLPITPAWMSGLCAWRGEVIAVIDLNIYLFEVEEPTLPSEGMLLVATFEETTLGLLVPEIGTTTMLSAEQALLPADPSLVSWPGILKGLFEGQPIIDMPVLFREAVQQIGMITSYG